MKKLLLEVIDKGRINLEHGSDILSEVIARRPPTDITVKTVIIFAMDVKLNAFVIG